MPLVLSVRLHAAINAKMTMAVRKFETCIINSVKYEVTNKTHDTIFLKVLDT
jgi:hypothetical protein